MFEMRGENAVQLEIFKSVAQHFPRGLGSKALAPIRYAQPVAKFGVAMLRVEPESNSSKLTSVNTMGDGEPEPAFIL